MPLSPRRLQPVAHATEPPPHLDRVVTAWRALSPEVQLAVQHFLAEERQRHSRLLESDGANDAADPVTVERRRREDRALLGAMDALDAFSCLDVYPSIQPADARCAARWIRGRRMVESAALEKGLARARALLRAVGKEKSRGLRRILTGYDVYLPWTWERPRLGTVTANGLAGVAGLLREKGLRVDGRLMVQVHSKVRPEVVAEAQRVLSDLLSEATVTVGDATGAGWFHLVVPFPYAILGGKRYRVLSEEQATR